MKLLVACLFLFNTCFVLSQDIVEPDSRLLTKYSKSKIEDMKTKSPEIIIFKNWELDNSYEIIEMDQLKVANIQTLKYFDSSTKTIGEDVQNIDLSNLNIHNYYFEREYKRPKHYRVSETGLVVVFLSQRKVAEKFNLFQNEK